MIERLTGFRRAVAARQRTAGGVLIAIGAVAVLTAATDAARSAIARDAARTRWAEREAEHAATGARRALDDRGREVMSRGAPIARLIVPRIGLDEIVVEGVAERDLRAGPGHMIGSVLPGAKGNSVISAHRDRHFRTLGGVAVGDTIHTESDAGDVAWTVTRVRVVGADAAVLRSTPTPTLTLTTCWPIRFFGSAPDRLIVEARPLS